MSMARQPQPQKRPAGAASVATPAARPVRVPPSGAGLTPSKLSSETRSPPVQSSPQARGQPGAPAHKASMMSPQRSSHVAVPERAASDPVLDGLITTIVGLEAVVEEETQALGTRQPVDLDTFSNRKSQGLMELNRSMKYVDPQRHSKLLAPRLDSLRTKLAANQAALQLHLEAVREISHIIANAIREDESDGTYSHTIRRPEAAYGYD